MKNRKKVLFIYNPKSGKGMIRHSLAAVIEILSQNGYVVTVCPTQKQGDGRRIVEEQEKNYDMIVCSGGDGTLDEIVTGLMNRDSQKPVGYIPTGSTNDFGRSLGISRQAERAAQTIADGEAYACDVGKFNEDYFVYVAAFGLFTEVSYETSQDIKNVLGHAAYLLEGMKRMGTWKSIHMKIESEEFSEESDYLYGMITNSDSIGGFKGLSGKNIELNDGLFEVMLVHTPQTILDWQEIVTAVLSADENSTRVIKFKTRCLKIESQEPVAWTLDGENGGEHTSILVENLREKFHIIVEQTASAVCTEKTEEELTQTEPV